MEELYERDDKPQQGNCGIYKIENLINGKVYIGQSICIKNRWQSHKTDGFNPKNKCYNRPLYRAFRKYGLENFDFSIIELCNPEELNKKEIYWISYYNSYGKEGYNLTPGGNEPIKVHPEELYKLWDKGYSTGKIVEYFKTINQPINKSTVSKYLKDYDNYSIHESKSRGQQQAERNYSKNPFQTFYNHIYQYDLDGTFINEWKSVFEITENLNLTDACIYDCINGKQLSSGGFQWKAEKYEKIDNIWGKTNYPIPVNCYDLKHNFIASYSSAQEAANIINGDRKNILKVCKGQDGRKSAYGYIWEYAINNWQKILEERNNKKSLKEKAFRSRVVEWPAREELKELIRNTPFTTIAKNYKVSAPAVRNWCRYYKLPQTKKDINSYSDEEWEKI